MSILRESTVFRGLLAFVEVLGFLAVAVGVENWSQPSFVNFPSYVCSTTVQADDGRVGPIVQCKS
jgi:hypothetical protein